MPTNWGVEEKPPVRVARGSSRDAFFFSAFWREPWCGLGCQIHPFHRWVVLPRHLYPAKHPSFGLRRFHWEGLTDSRGSHPLGLRLPSSYAPQFLPCVPLRGLPTYPEPNPVFTAASPSRAVYQSPVYRPSEPSRPARVVIRSLWNHPLSMVLLYHIRLGLSRVFWKFFSRIFQPRTREFARRKVCAQPPRRPLARLRRASLGRVGVRVPPCDYILPYPIGENNCKYGKVFHQIIHLGGGPARLGVDHFHPICARKASTSST